MAPLTGCVSLLTVLTLCFEGALTVSTTIGSNSTDCSSAACPVSPLEITCTHTNIAGGFTLWRATQMGEEICLLTVNHNAPGNTACIDDQVVVLNIVDVTDLTTTSPDCLSSTATFPDPTHFEGLVVECYNSSGVNADDLVGSCALLFIPPPAAPTGLSLTEDDITGTTVIPPPGTRDITLRWEAPASEAAIATYTVTSAQHGPMNTTIPELTVPVDEGMSYIFTVVAIDMCGQTSNQSEPLNVTVTVPSAPGSLTASVVFDRSNSSFTLSLEWPLVMDTPDIAVRGSGEVLIDGRIRNYQITLPNNESVSVLVPCNAITCSIVFDGQLDVNATGILVSVTPVNAIGVGGSLQRVCNEFQVTPTESSPTDVTLTCATQSCAISYYRASSPDTVLTGTSGVPLEVLTEALYFYEVNFQCGGFDVTVTDNFGICECLLSALFGGAGVEETVCPQAGFARAVRAAGGSTGGAVCFDSTTNSSEAVYVCESDRDPCIRDCGAKCSCSPGQTVGQWNRTFSPQELCPLIIRGLSTGAIVGIVIGALIGLLLLAAIVALVVWLFCCRPDSGTPKKSKKLTDEEHELREPSPITHDPNALYSNPTDIRHEPAPESHDEYAMLDTHTKKKPKTAPKAQESGELQKQVGPEGDVYTVPVPKRGSSKRKQESPPPSLPPPSEEQLAEMYATPDMTQKSRNKNIAPALFYADIGVSGPSRPAPVPAAGQVTYSTIAGTEPGPVEVVVEPTYAN